METVFVGQCEVFVCLGFIDYFFLFFPLAAKLIVPQTGCQFFKNVDFLDNHPLKCYQSLQVLLGATEMITHWSWATEQKRLGTTDL